MGWVFGEGFQTLGNFTHANLNTYVFPVVPSPTPINDPTNLNSYMYSIFNVIGQPYVVVYRA